MLACVGQRDRSAQALQDSRNPTAPPAWLTWLAAGLGGPGALGAAAASFGATLLVGLLLSAALINKAYPPQTLSVSASPYSCVAASIRRPAEFTVCCLNDLPSCGSLETPLTTTGSPSTCNAHDAKVMFARRWSATTDKRGGVAIKVGPAPIPVRWRVEAKGYAAETTRRFELFDNKDAVLADVKLRPGSLLHVRIHLPADAEPHLKGLM